MISGGPLNGFELDGADVLLGHLAAEWVPTGSLSARLTGFLHTSDRGGAAQRHIDDPNPDRRQLTQDFPSTFGLDNQSLAATVDWDTPWGLKFRFLTGLQNLSKNQTMDGDRLTENLVSIDLTGFGPANFDLLPFWDNESQVFSQELNLLGSGNRVDWIAGLYYLYHRNRNYFLEAVGPAPGIAVCRAVGESLSRDAPAFPGAARVCRGSHRHSTGHGGLRSGHVPTRQPLVADLCRRWQNDRATDETTQFWYNDSVQTVADQALTWRLGADVRLTDSSLLYLAASTGWKNGGSNPGAQSGAALDVPPVFQPEEVMSLELGSRNMLWRGRAQINATAFYYDYQNFQFIQEDPVPFSAGTGNISDVEMYGLETEFSFLTTDRLRLDGHLTVLDGAIESELYTLDVVDFLNSGFGRFTETGVEDRASLRVNLAGNEPPKLADLTGRLLLTHTQPLAGGSLLISRLELVHRGEFQYRVFNNPLVDTVPAYETVGLFFGYEPATWPLALGLHLTNLLDEAGVNSRFTNPFGLHTTSEELIPPRQLMLKIGYRF